MVNQQPLQPALDGSLPGDFGFDPIGLSNIDAVSLPQIIPPAASMAPDEPLPTIYWMREAELKHARLAMIAAAGWPLQELLNPFGGASNGRAPRSKTSGSENPRPLGTILAFASRRRTVPSAHSASRPSVRPAPRPQPLQRPAA